MIKKERPEGGHRKRALPLTNKRIPSNSHVGFDGISLFNFSSFYKSFFEFIGVYIGKIVKKREAPNFLKTTLVFS